jgi:hypothetical protein
MLLRDFGIYVELVILRIYVFYNRCHGMEIYAVKGFWALWVNTTTVTR